MCSQPHHPPGSVSQNRALTIMPGGWLEQGHCPTPEGPITIAFYRGWYTLDYVSSWNTTRNMCPSPFGQAASLLDEAIWKRSQEIWLWSRLRHWPVLWPLSEAIFLIIKSDSMGWSGFWGILLCGCSSTLQFFVFMFLRVKDHPWEDSWKENGLVDGIIFMYLFINSSPGPTGLNPSLFEGP